MWSLKRKSSNCPMKLPALSNVWTLSALPTTNQCALASTQLTRNRRCSNATTANESRAGKTALSKKIPLWSTHLSYSCLIAGGIQVERVMLHSTLYSKAFRFVFHIQSFNRPKLQFFNACSIFILSNCPKFTQYFRQEHDFLIIFWFIRIEFML